MVQSGDGAGNSPTDEHSRSGDSEQTRVAGDRTNDQATYPLSEEELDDLGISRDLWSRCVCWISPPGAELWRESNKPIPILTGSNVRIYGIVMPELPESGDGFHYFAFPNPRELLMRDGWHVTAVGMEILMITVMAPGGNVVGSRRSMPNSPMAFALSWPAVDVPQDEIRRIKKALDALGMVKRGGGPTPKDDNQHRRELARIVNTTRKLLRKYADDGKRPKEEDVASALHISLRTLLRRIQPEYQNFAELLASLADAELERSLQ